MIINTGTLSALTKVQCEFGFHIIEGYLLSRNNFSCLTSGRQLQYDCILAISLEKVVYWTLCIHFRLACVSLDVVKGPVRHNDLGCLMLLSKRGTNAMIASTLLSLLHL